MTVTVAAAAAVATAVTVVAVVATVVAETVGGLLRQWLRLCDSGCYYCCGGSYYGRPARLFVLHRGSSRPTCRSPGSDGTTLQAAAVLRGWRRWVSRCTAGSGGVGPCDRDSR